MTKENISQIYKRIKNFAYHPLLISLAPIISLYDHNKDIASPQYLIRPLAVSFLTALALFWLINLFVKNHKKTAIMVSFYIVTFFLYPLYSELFMFVDQWVPYDSLAIAVTLLLWLAVGLLVAKSPKNFKALSSYLNIFAIIITLIPASSIAYYEYQTTENNNAIEIKTVANNNDYPDIYYIILDGYGREDVLKSLYNYDNGSFIESLKNKGFFIAEKSTANYAQSYLSMNATLNLDYLDKLANLNPQSNDRRWLKDKLKNNYVHSFLKNKGYVFASLPATWVGNYDNIKADIEIKDRLKNNDFDNLIITSSPLKILTNQKYILENYKKRVEFIFDKLGEISEIKESTFIYVHLLMPHPPFIFDKNGEIVFDVICAGDGSHYYRDCPGGDGSHYYQTNIAQKVDDYHYKYIEQLQYINKKISQSIDYILANSDKDPIIILQADHGPGSMLNWEDPEKTNMKERFSILNAYYVPENTKKELSDDISPVNSFRIIFNSVFGSDFEILETKNYFSTWSKPYNFINVTDRLQSN